MLRSMYSGISGLKNFQTKLDVIGNNIANVNTYGFKKGRVTFKDMMSQTVAGASAATANRGGTNPKQVGLGSTLATIDTIHDGASLQTTNRSLDLGIDGDGYFVVRKGDALYYTRAGNFYLDDNGTLVNGDGLPVQAYQVDENGNPTNVYGDVMVNINGVMSPTPTTKITIAGNLDAAAKVASNPITKDDFIYTQQMKIIHTDGKAYTVDVHFVKTGTDTWSIFINRDPVGKGSSSADINAVYNSTNQTWNLTNGSGSAIGAGNPLEVLLSDNGTPSDTTDDVTLNLTELDFSNLTQLQGSTTAMPDANGNLEGRLESFNFGSMGEINGVYSNGEIVTLGRLALAKFSNTSGLMKAGNNLFQESINSGVPNIGPAGEGRGTIVSGSLEMSNVDLSEEFTEMIVAQRGFQANTRIITTSDEILQELVNLKR